MAFEKGVRYYTAGTLAVHFNELFALGVGLGRSKKARKGLV